MEIMSTMANRHGHPKAPPRLGKPMVDKSGLSKLTPGQLAARNRTAVNRTSGAVMALTGG